MTHFLVDSNLWAPKGINTAFSLRSGGSSAGPYSSFNVGVEVGDELAVVTKNRAQLETLLSLPRVPQWLHQVHGTRVHDFSKCTSLESNIIADAAVTRREGVVLAIQVADCLPVLFAAEDGSVIGAAHAGWRGLVAGVLENTVATMQCAPQFLHAWLGPCIGPTYFEVGSEVRAAFLEAGDDGAGFCFNAQGRWHCNLLTLARGRLQKLGLKHVSGGHWCTATDPEKFFSHRRDQCTGRMVALIWKDVII